MLPYIGLAIITAIEVVIACIRGRRAYFKYPVVSKITAAFGIVEAVVAICIDWPISAPPTMFVSILIAVAVANLALSMRCKTLHNKHWGGVIKRATRGDKIKQRRIYRNLDNIQTWGR
ncbi:MAG: hypothetical protein JWO07_142 [Candidatus Saccharibacteria bacterium]|nr:hypothetical protein [Candidatus Saccharibacteria bacterium]